MSTHNEERDETRVGTDLSADSPQVRALYRERAHLLAVLATHYPARLAANDECEPELAVLYLHTPAGQLSWHVSPHDMDLFTHVAGDDAADTDALIIGWDGHDKQEALARLRRLIELERGQ